MSSRRFRPLPLAQATLQGEAKPRAVVAEVTNKLTKGAVKAAMGVAAIVAVVAVTGAVTVVVDTGAEAAVVATTVGVMATTITPVVLVAAVVRAALAALAVATMGEREELAIPTCPSTRERIYSLPKMW